VKRVRDSGAGGLLIQAAGWADTGHRPADSQTSFNIARAPLNATRESQPVEAPLALVGLRA